jgi:hypothetical protein
MKRVTFVGEEAALDRTITLQEEVSMSRSLGNNKRRTNHDRGQHRMLALFAMTAGLVLAIAAFVGIVF